MAERPDIAGIVLAGGRSSRMGKNKALLDYHGKPLLEHMIEILQESGIEDVFISGSVEGYACLEDRQPYAGPACAIRHVLKQKPGYKGYLFVPVDMPHLNPAILQELISKPEGGYFTGWPLPVFLTPPISISEAASVQEFIDAQGISPMEIPCPFEKFLMNANTPQQWEEALATS